MQSNGRNFVMTTRPVDSDIVSRVAKELDMRLVRFSNLILDDCNVYCQLYEFIPNTEPCINLAIDIARTLRKEADCNVAKV